MPIPLIPLIVAGGAGIVGTAVGSMFGGSDTKKEIHATQEHYAPVKTDARALSQVYSPSYQYQISSPEARMSSKKDIDSRARSDPDISPTRTESMSEGVDMTKIAIIGVVGLIVYGVVSK